MKTLDIRVAFSAVDRLTRPAENARRLMGQFGDSIQRTQGAIKNLERQARSFERARDAVSKADAGIVKARRQLHTTGHSGCAPWRTEHGNGWRYGPR